VTLFFYVFREYIKYVVGTVVLTMFLFTLFDFIHKSTKYFSEYQPDTEYIIQFYLLQMPSQIVQALPIASLLASVVAMILLSRTNEITAMRAAGMGAIRLGAPLAAGGLFLSIGALLLGEFVVPKFSQKMHYVQDVLIEGDSDTEILEGARWMRSGESLINFGDYDPLAQIMSRVKFLDVRENFRPKRLLQALTHCCLSDKQRGTLMIEHPVYQGFGSFHHV
jgi:lipopolysaccharide export system permease protein